MVTISFKLADIKLESSEAYLLKLGKICCGISRVFSFFVKTRKYPTFILIDMQVHTVFSSKIT